MLIISTAKMHNVNFAPQSVMEEVEQNVYTILNTLKGSVPLDREFGLSTSLTDQPIPAARAKLVAEIISAIRLYEPRFKVAEVTFEEIPNEGILKPAVKGEIIV